MCCQRFSTNSAVGQRLKDAWNKLPKSKKDRKEKKNKFYYKSKKNKMKDNKKNGNKNGKKY